MVDESSSTEQQPSRRILMLTNVERGEANVFLATCNALIAQDPLVQIHFGCFSGLESTVKTVWNESKQAVPEARFPITYHVIDGPNSEESLHEVFKMEGIEVHGSTIVSTTKKLSFSVTKQLNRELIGVFMPYTTPRLIQIFDSIVQIINSVNADVVLIDSLFSAALTACCYLDVPFICLSPNAIKDFAAPLQPRQANLWKFPAMCSGYRYPVPWHQIPLNIFWNIFFVHRWLNYTRGFDTARDFKKQTGAEMKTPLDYIRNQPKNLKMLVSTWPEIDFPLVKPDYIVPCGPIIRKAAPVQSVDSELADWLNLRPTLYVNLGSLFQFTEEWAVEMAKALVRVLEKGITDAKGRPLQILWKIKKLGEFETTGKDCPIGRLVHDFQADDRLRIVKWLEPEPSAVLRSGNIVCAVHHGGANSFNEVLVAGIPHVILPVWTDCYDYAERVELHGIGIHGSRNNKPRWEVNELSDAILAVLQGPRSASMKQKATALAEMCREKGDGAGNVAREVIAHCEALARKSDETNS